MTYPKYTIGYIDEDPKEVKTFTRKLRDFGLVVIGYSFTKGMSLNELMSQVYNSEIDILLIDYKLKGTKVAFNGEEVESDFYDKKPLFPHIIFTSKTDDAEDSVEDWKIIYDKEELLNQDPKRKQKFVDMLVKSIEQYKNYIKRRQEIIVAYLQKEESEGLNAKEKSDLIKAQIELENLDKTKAQEVPEQLLNKEKLDELSESRLEAERILDELISKNKNNESKR